MRMPRKFTCNVTCAGRSPLLCFVVSCVSFFLYCSGSNSQHQCSRTLLTSLRTFNVTYNTSSPMRLNSLSPLCISSYWTCTHHTHLCLLPSPLYYTETTHTSLLLNLPIIPIQTHHYLITLITPFMTSSYYLILFQYLFIHSTWICA